MGLIVGIVLGVLGLGTCGGLMCLGGAKRKREAKQEQGVAVSAEVQRAAFRTLLGQLLANPTAVKPTKVDDDEVMKKYAYAPPPDAPANTLTLEIDKPDKSAKAAPPPKKGAKPAASAPPPPPPSAGAGWQFEATAKTKLAPEDFAPPKGFAAIEDDDQDANWFELTDGPLKGALLSVAKDGSKANAMSLPHAVQWPGDGLGIFRWACDNGKIPGAKALDRGSFKQQCKDIVRGQLALPNTAEFAGMLSPGLLITGSRCGRTWKSWVEAKNAFGMTIKRTFVCTYDPKDDTVSASLDR